MQILRTLRRKLRVARSLSWQDWGDLAQAWVMLLLVDIGLRTMPFLRLKSLLEKTHVGKIAGDPQQVILRFNRLVEIASHNHLYKITCLRQALVLQWLLRRRGLETDLKIGVRKEDDLLAAHAWVEYKGTFIGQSQGQLARSHAVLDPRTQP